MVAHTDALTPRSAATTFAALALLLVGCATERPLYHWGPYENLVYQMYAEPGKADPGVQVEKLSRDISLAHANGEHVAPGVHLHLGTMYLLQGNAGAARQQMETEKRLFPESSVFVDRLLAGMRAP